MPTPIFATHLNRGFVEVAVFCLASVARFLVN